MREKRISPFYRLVKLCVKAVYPKITVEGSEKLPSETVIIVGNHTQIHGPIISQLYLEENTYTWCIGEMMHFKDVPKYAYNDFWSRKSKSVRWLYKIVSYLIAPLSVFIFNNANTIGVYKDKRILSTFKNTVRRLSEGNNVVIFPECDDEYNNIINNFQSHFVDVARLYYKKTAKQVSFVPMYVAPKLKKVFFGDPVRFNADNDMDSERERIREYLMNSITQIAVGLPRHTVVPYRNVKKKFYPSNKEAENEKTGS